MPLDLDFTLQALDTIETFLATSFYNFDTQKSVVKIYEENDEGLFERTIFEL